MNCWQKNSLLSNVSFFVLHTYLRPIVRNWCCEWESGKEIFQLCVSSRRKLWFQHNSHTRKPTPMWRDSEPLIVLSTVRNEKKLQQIINCGNLRNNFEVYFIHLRLICRCKVYEAVFHLSLLNKNVMMKRMPRNPLSYLRMRSLSIQLVSPNLCGAYLGAPLTRSLTTLSRMIGRRGARSECPWPWCSSGQYSSPSSGWRSPSVSGSSTETRARNSHSLSAQRFVFHIFFLHITMYLHMYVCSFRTGLTWGPTAARNTPGVMTGNSISPSLYQVRFKCLLINRQDISWLFRAVSLLWPSTEAWCCRTSVALHWHLWAQSQQTLNDYVHEMLKKILEAR